MNRQLNLFTKRRAKKLPPAPEFNTHCMIADDLKRFISPDWRATHLPMGEHRDHRTDRYGNRYSPTGNRLRRMGTTPGWPDFMICGPGPTVFWLELKRARKGRLSAAQADIAEHLTRCGFAYLCTDSYNEAKAALIERGILRGAR
jgi:hypothetical protein